MARMCLRFYDRWPNHEIIRPPGAMVRSWKRASARASSDRTAVRSGAELRRDHRHMEEEGLARSTYSRRVFGDTAINGAKAVHWLRIEVSLRPVRYGTLSVRSRGRYAGAFATS